MVYDVGVGPLLDRQLLLHILVILAGTTSGILATLGIVAFTRRRSVPFFLVALALLFLLGKATVGLLSLGGVVSVELHNLIEHAIDFLIATLLLGAILEARNPEGCGVGGWIDMRTDR